MSRLGQQLLQEVTIRYCQHGGSSQGLREYLSSQSFEAWRKAHPGVRIRLGQRGARHPTLTALYAHGGTQEVCVRNEAPKAVVGWLDRLRSSRGFKPRLLTESKRKVTTRASIQGPWTPDFEPPGLSAGALANATARLNFRTLRPYDHSRHVYPSSHLAATPQPAIAARVEAARVSKADRAKARRARTAQIVARAQTLVAQERAWAAKIMDEALANKPVSPSAALPAQKGQKK